MNDVPSLSEHELNISRLVDARPDILYRCWTEPALVVKWFTPAPWKTKSCDYDLRVGGVSLIVMESPEGDSFPNPGMFLAIEPNQRLVFTDAFQEGWRPSQRPFMVGEVTFVPEEQQTRYTARAHHWNAEACQEHNEMGFHVGWNKALDQLLELAKTL